MFGKRNARARSSILLVFIWKDINVIKKLKKLHPCHPERHRCNFFYYIYVIPDGHKKNTKRNSSISRLVKYCRITFSMIDYFTCIF